MRRARRSAAVLVTSTVLILGAEVALGQFGRGFGSRVPPRFPTAESFDGRFNFCRVMYQSGRRDGSGNGWTTDYPDADINFSIRLSELTKTPVSWLRGREPNHLVVRLTDPYLFQCPFVLISDVGELYLSVEEAARLRQYLDKGGFLWADDYWGSWAWAAWAEEIAKVLPPGEFPIRDVDPSHPIFRTMFEVKEFPQIPSINSWRGMGGSTSELGPDSAIPSIRAITDRKGRMMVLMTHNTDISDSWEREGEDPQYFYSFSPGGYAVGINIVVYAMSH
jgi:hypothetical protein